MPWKVVPVSEIRVAFVHQVVSLKVSVAEACRAFGISRKTGYKWLKRHQEAPHAVLVDRSRRPRRSPGRCEEAVELAIVAVRRRFRWGPEKIHDHLVNQSVPTPSARTVANVLRRRGLVPPPRPEPAVQFFQREMPHELWQCDFKGPLEVGRRKVHPFTVLDDHSRYLLVLHACMDMTMATAFALLWEAFGEFGLPEGILCDNSFGSPFQVPRTLSWFETQLIRLGIRPLHGRPYHPQTQGKVERLHGTLERELFASIRRDCIPHFQQDLDRWRTEVYNPLRPHEALGGQPPQARFAPSPRVRPLAMPEVQYPPGSILRKVSSVGDIRWHKYRILAGRGLVGQYVRIEDRGHEVALFYSWKEIRSLANSQLKPDTML